ncbi:hypothetical protein ACIGNX_26910 [Actinosynnema sp. NPDC053489]|uniref:hypothetical protein n=1 Tax=Actinosynnema sp. NPDC053489 TaxID=3363916 RepID=UPI0037C7192B
MDKIRAGCWAVLALVVAQAVATLLSGDLAEMRFVGLAFNAAAAFSASLVLRRPTRNRWPLVAWSAAFFGWHATGVLTLAGLVATGLDAVFAVGGDLRLSTFYQVVLTTLAAFAVHLLLPRPDRRAQG